MSKKNEQPETPPSETDKVGYGQPPKHSQFKKGQSGNPKGRPKEVQAHMPVSRIIRHSLSEEVQGQVNGKTRKMTKLEAIIDLAETEAEFGGQVALAGLRVGLQQPEHLQSSFVVWHCGLMFNY